MVRRAVVIDAVVGTVVGTVVAMITRTFVQSVFSSKNRNAVRYIDKKYIRIPGREVSDDKAASIDTNQSEREQPNPTNNQNLGNTLVEDSPQHEEISDIISQFMRRVDRIEKYGEAGPGKAIIGYRDAVFQFASQMKDVVDSLGEDEKAPINAFLDMIDAQLSNNILPIKDVVKLIISTLESVEDGMN